VLKKKGESWATLVAPFFFALLIGGSEAGRPLSPRLSPLREEHFIGGFHSSPRRGLKRSKKKLFFERLPNFFNFIGGAAAPHGVR